MNLQPNPFNPVTIINYSISEPSYVKLEIYSVSGQKVITLVDGYMNAGKNYAVFDGSKLATGIYFFSFQSNKFRKTGKMMLVK